MEWVVCRGRREREREERNHGERSRGWNRKRANRCVRRDVSGHVAGISVCLLVCAYERPSAAETQTIGNRFPFEILPFDSTSDGVDDPSPSPFPSCRGKSLRIVKSEWSAATCFYSQTQFANRNRNRWRVLNYFLIIITIAIIQFFYVYYPQKKIFEFVQSQFSCFTLFDKFLDCTILLSKLFRYCRNDNERRTHTRPVMRGNSSHRIDRSW